MNTEKKLYCIVLVCALLFACGNTAFLGGKGEQSPVVGTSLEGFRISPWCGEQEFTYRYPPAPDVRIHINAPQSAEFDPSKRTGIVLYTLPNGNSIEYTSGKTMLDGDDWHYNIQHIAAQTRFLRRRIRDYNMVVAYLETAQRSWPSWKREHPDHIGLIQNIVDDIVSRFGDYDPFLVLNGHSGGGSFIFGYLDGVETVPDTVERIAFLDSNYSYDDNRGKKMADWLKASPSHNLFVIAYNDSIALYKGKPFVSATGGTWHRSHMMAEYLSTQFAFDTGSDAEFDRYTALNGRVRFILKKNPKREILHTVQVERNGFIHSMLAGTSLEGVDYEYYGPRAYGEWIRGRMPGLKALRIPPRRGDAPPGSAVMRRVENLTSDEREQVLFDEIMAGNIPAFLRKTVTIESLFEDAEGTEHTVLYEVLPDYLAVGSDDDFCRIPIGPATAQKIADRFGACLPTRKLVDDIYIHADIKLEPVTYYPVGNANELVDKFVEHNTAIEAQRAAASASPGQLVAGIKKDVVLSNRIVEPDRPGHVVIYGWHRLDGKAIQPLTNIHFGHYVDYSHGVRLMNSGILVDGVPMEMTDVLRDPVLYRLVSDEDGVMSTPRYR